MKLTGRLAAPRVCCLQTRMLQSLQSGTSMTKVRMLALLCFYHILTDFEPDGARFYYSSATTNILTAVLRNTFELSEEYANFPRKELYVSVRHADLQNVVLILCFARFEPLGMSSALIQTDSKGLFIMSSFGQEFLCI